MQQNRDPKSFLGKRIFLSTSLVAPEQRKEFWRSVLLPIFEPVEVESQIDVGFQGALSVSKLGRLTIGQLTFNAQKTRFSQKLIRQGKFDGFLFQVFMSGHLKGHYGGNVVSVAPGDIIIRDIQRPAETEVTGGRTLMAIVPRNLLRKHIAEVLHGLVLPASAPETRILTEFLFSLEAQGEQVSLGASAQLEKAFLDMFEANIQSAECRRKLAGYDASIPLRDRVLNYIDQNLDDPELDIESMLKKFHVSRAHLYRVFKCDGGISKFIQKRRLEAAYMALTDPQFEHRSIEEIAYQSGFASSKQLSRAFRGQFNTTPGAVRIKDSANGILVRVNDAYHHFEDIARQYSLLPS